MSVVFLTAIGVGGATIIGALVGFLFRGLSHKFSNLIVSFAAGIMLSAAVLGLVLPSIEYGGKWGVAVAVLGILVGGICINLSDRLVPHIQKIVAPHPSAAPPPSPVGEGSSKNTVKGVLLFVIAIGIHNLPEGMVIIAPMLSAGISPRKTFVLALITGISEVVGTLIGYFAVSLASAVLPFALAFAGGAMLFVISEEMIPECHASGEECRVTYAFLCGFCCMLVLDAVM